MRLACRKKLVAFVALTMVAAASADAATCEQLRALRITKVVITAAESVAAGRFVPPDQSKTVPPGVAPPSISQTTLSALAAFCRVQGEVRPSTDSHIRFEVWLPMSKWNGRYLGIGNGGAAGFISYEGNLDTPGLIQALQQGFATAATDTGHEGSADDYSFGRNHPQRRIDYSYRAIHETAVTAKSIIRSFYGTSPRYSYFWGRSIGGTQALMEVQRYPADYDGVLAASPIVDRARTWEAWVWIAQAFGAADAQIPADKLPLIQAAVLGVCDGVDGLPDGIISEPTKCHFDPAVLGCTGTDLSGCLTAPQVSALRSYYAGPRNANGERIAPSFLPGAEACLGNSMTCPGAAARRASNWVGGLMSERWDVRTFDFDGDIRALERDPDVINGSARDSNLTAFSNRGGKLILEHGWSDGTAIPAGTVKYYEDLVSRMGVKTTDTFVRLYMVPGMSHSGGAGLRAAPTGPGLKRFEALERWVEAGEAPSALVATKYVIDGQAESGVLRTRLLCPYPQLAVYGGTGSVDDGKNFSCTTR